ncbi:MAG: hypothetical protein KF842_10135 [Caulobacter sp.]|nr:hypothetical protein [Caulobacter sp.]
MERAAIRIVESPFDRAADVRARSSNALYLLELIGQLLLFAAVNLMVQQLIPDAAPLWFRILLAIGITVMAGRLHDSLRIRYGRKRRDEEIAAEAEAQDLADLRAGKVNFPPVVV